MLFFHLEGHSFCNSKQEEEWPLPCLGRNAEVKTGVSRTYCFCLTWRKRKICPKRQQIWGGTRVVPNTGCCVYSAKDRRRERRQREMNFLCGNIQCGQRKKTPFFQHPSYWKAMGQKIDWHCKWSLYLLQVIIVSDPCISSRHVHTAGQCQWGNVCLSIQVWKQVVCRLHKCWAIGWMALVWDHCRLWCGQAIWILSLEM